MRIVIFVLCALLSLGTSAEAQRRHRHSRHPVHHGSHKNPRQLRSELSDVREQKNHLRQEYVKTRHQANVVVQDIHVVDARIEQIETALSQTSDQLSVGRHQQLELSKELAAATIRVAKVRAQVGQRLRYMYTHQGESVISAFAGVRTVEDLESTKYLLESIAKKDHELFGEYRSLRAELADKKRRQDALVVRIAGLKRRQQSQHLAWESNRWEKAQTLSDLRGKQQHIQEMIAQFEADEREIASEIESYEAAARARRNRPGAPPEVVFRGRFMRPARGPIVSGFGMRYHPILHKMRLHTGVDFGAPYGSPIVAAGDGIVIVARYSQSYGNMVVIDHGNGLSTVYAHASRLYVSSGRHVRRGERIAAVGATGLATGPHLHFEVRVNGVPVNPISRL